MCTINLKLSLELFGNIQEETDHHCFRDLTNIGLLKSLKDTKMPKHDCHFFQDADEADCKPKLSNKEMYANLKKYLASIKESCGQVCDTSMTGEQGKYYQVIMINNFSE